MTTNKPNIILSELDLNRLEHLLATHPGINADVRDKLEEELERADVVDPAEVPPNVVTMNSTVRFSVSASSETFTLTLVYPKDMTADGKTISILAPAGSAMLGLVEGDEISWPTPDGKELKVHVEEVIYQPERAGELHR